MKKILHFVQNDFERLFAKNEAQSCDCLTPHLVFPADYFYSKYTAIFLSPVI